jgi:DsbC/DsbD-like thiol-disulfide interchange protein
VGGYLDYVYRGHVVLPLSVTLAGPALLAADVTLGVCSDICVPASATFTLPLAFEKPDPGNGLRLAQAMAEVPLAWSGATSLVGEARYEPGQGLWLAIDPTGLDPLSLIADLGVEGPLFGAPQKSRDADLVLFPVVGSKGKEELVGKIVTITFKTPQGSFEMMREIAAPQSTGERPAARKS